MATTRASLRSPTAQCRPDCANPLVQLTLGRGSVCISAPCYAHGPVSAGRGGGCVRVRGRRGHRDRLAIRAHRPDRPSAVSRAGTVWAVNTSGQKVPVTTPAFTPTPVHPEKVTHPGADYMGAVNIAHAPWGHSSPVRPATSAAMPRLPGIDI